LKRALDLDHVVGRQQSEHQQYAGLLRCEILAGDDAALAQPSARGDAAGRTAALHDDDPGVGGALEGGALLGGRASRGKPAETIPRAPAATAASTSAPSAPA